MRRFRVSDDGRAPCRVALAPLLTAGRMCQNRKIENGLAGDFCGQFFVDSFSQVRWRSGKLDEGKKEPGQESLGKDARNSQVAGRGAPNYFLLRIRPRDARFRYKSSGR